MGKRGVEMSDLKYPTIQPIIAPVGDIVLVSQDKTQFKYAPKDDITNIELARIIQLMTIAATAHIGLSWEPFVKQHNLWRHFDKVQSDCKPIEYITPED